MSYEIFVYAPTGDDPSVREISGLLDLAGWEWVPITSIETFSRNDALQGSIALGWDLADDIGDSVITAVEHENPDLLSGPIELLSVVEISIEAPFRPDPEAISELRESNADPDLVTRVEEAATCYLFSARGEITEQHVEFLWALASAVGVLTDGVLEDGEDGTLLDCTQDGD